MKQWLSPEKVINFSASITLTIIPLAIVFFWNVDFDLEKVADSSKIGAFGDFFGGIVGSFWAFTGVLLFYSALKDQRKDFEINRNAFQKQIEALKLQTEEFSLQRDELKATRKVAIEQAKTQKQQRLESTYFSLLELYSNVLISLNTSCQSKKFFKELRDELLEEFTPSNTPSENHQLTQSLYLKWFYKHKEELTHYFKTIYRIIKIIDESEIEDTEKYRYIKILRSQLSENEMLIIYYNSHSIYGEDLYKLILKYNLLKHLPNLSKIEFTKFSKDHAQLPTLLRFNNLVSRQLEAFIKERDQELTPESSCFSRRYLFGEAPEATVIISSTEHNNLTLEISENSLAATCIHLDINIDEIINYFKLFFWDIFFFSVYSNISHNEKIESKREGNEIQFTITSSRKLIVSTDKE